MGVSEDGPEDVKRYLRFIFLIFIFSLVSIIGSKG